MQIYNHVMATITGANSESHTEICLLTVRLGSYIEETSRSAVGVICQVDTRYHGDVIDGERQKIINGKKQVPIFLTSCPSIYTAD